MPADMHHRETLYEIGPGLFHRDRHEKPTSIHNLRWMPLEFRATKLKQRLARYAKRDGNFVLVDSGGFEADDAKQLLEIVYNLLKMVVQSPPINQGQYTGGGSGPQANSSNTVKSVAFNVRSDVTSAARYVAASNCVPGLPETGDPRHPRSFKPKMRVPFSPPDVQPSTMARKIISGGQTGAYHASLDFVTEVGLLHGR